MKKALVLFIISCLFASCSTIIPMFMKKKKANARHSALAQEADAYFWKQFHEGNYDSIPQVLMRLKQAYLENPNNATIVAHIAFTHAWAGSERIRIKDLRPDVIDHYDLAVKYFEEARQLNPKDVRLQGFHGDFMMAAGGIANDNKKTVKGYFEAKAVTKKWPEWGDFTLSYVLSLSSKDDKRFQEAIDLMWHNLETCVCEKVDRSNPDFSKYYDLLKTDLKEKNRRACWNSWIAPHNLEGFFIHFGDILVKSGDWQLGIKMYENAKTSQEYDSYPYKALLEDRIKNAALNAERFNNYGQSTPTDSRKVLMVDSELSCMGCHQKTKYIPIPKAQSYVAPHLK